MIGRKLIVCMKYRWEKWELALEQFFQRQKKEELELEVGIKFSRKRLTEDAREESKSVEDYRPLGGKGNCDRAASAQRVLNDHTLPYDTIKCKTERVDHVSGTRQWEAVCCKRICVSRLQPSPVKHIRDVVQ